MEQPYPRDFDRPQPLPVAVISGSRGSAVWPDQDPIGALLACLLPAVRAARLDPVAALRVD